MAEDQIVDESAMTEAAKTEDAIQDLERIEEEVVAEAEASVEDFDKMGDVDAAAAAAETAAEFEEAIGGTEEVEKDLEK